MSRIRKQRIWLGIVLIPIALGFTSVSWGGAFINALGAASALNNQLFIMHPQGYTGAGAALTINLCIPPGSPNALAMVTPVANIAATMTAKLGQTGNLGTSNAGDTVPGGEFDFEAIALHEVGHCLGLAHTNAATESGLGGADENYTKAAAGGNAVLNVAAGVDTIIGSSDDDRTPDDISVHWFRIGSNDPCAAPGTTTFDSTTYTVAGALPGGHAFAANPDRAVCAALGSASTEAVMQQGTFPTEAQRRLGHDDEAMLRLAMSGLDETQGSADDHTLTVVSNGISAVGCDINIEFDDTETTFAVCKTTFFTSLDPDGVGGNPPDTDHGALATANAFFNNAAVTWFFNTTPVQLQSFEVE